MTGQRGELEIIEEREMLSLARGKDQLKFRFVRARTSDGKDLAWHDLRLWQGGRPSQKGLSLRTGELRPLLDVLTRATSGTPDDTPQPVSERASPKPDGAVAPFGRNKGELLAELEDEDVQWLREALQRSIEDPAKATYLAKNQRDLALIEAELRSRFVE